MGVAKKTVKSELQSDSIPTSKSPPDSSNEIQASNKKIAFLEDVDGVPSSNDRLNTMSKAYTDILNGLARLLCDLFPHTWAVAGERFKSFVTISMFNKFIEFRLCDGFWKVLEYCSVKFSDWERNGMPASVKQQKTELKRKRREEKNRKRAPPPPGADVVDLDDDNSTSPPPGKKPKPAAGPSASSSTAPTVLAPTNPPPIVSLKETSA